MTERKNLESRKKFSKIQIFVFGIVVGILFSLLISQGGSTLFMEIAADKMAIRDMFLISNCADTFSLLKDSDKKEYAKLNTALERKLENSLAILDEISHKENAFSQSDKEMLLKIKEFLKTRPIPYSSEENKQKISSLLNGIK